MAIVVFSNAEMDKFGMAIVVFSNAEMDKFGILRLMDVNVQLVHSIMDFHVFLVREIDSGTLLEIDVNVHYLPFGMVLFVYPVLMEEYGTQVLTLVTVHLP